MRRALIAVSLALAARPASALSLATGGSGTSGADFLTVGVGARALAMGGAFSAVDTGADANAVNWNPAALALVERSNVTASYNSLFEDQNQGYVGYAAPFKDGGGVWSAGLDYLIISNIERRAADTESPDSTFSNTNYAAGYTYARRFGDSWSAGATLKYVREELAGSKGNAMALDFGAQAKTPVEGLTAAATMRNLGTDIGPDSMPLTLTGGAAYKMLAQKLVLDTDLNWLATERRAYWSLGGEYWITPNLAGRGGYQFGHGADGLHSSLVGLGVGLGLKFDRFTMDYAFQPYGDLGNTHRMTLGMRFQ